MEALCRPGSYSSTGMEPCYLCDKGYYQTMAGQSSCLACSPTLTTPIKGSNSSMQCAGVNSICVLHQVFSNRPRSIYLNSSMASRLSGQTSICSVVSLSNVQD